MARIRDVVHQNTVCRCSTSSGLASVMPFLCNLVLVPANKSSVRPIVRNTFMSAKSVNRGNQYLHCYHSGGCKFADKDFLGLQNDDEKVHKVRFV